MFRSTLVFQTIFFGLCIFLISGMSIGCRPENGGSYGLSSATVKLSSTPIFHNETITPTTLIAKKTTSPQLRPTTTFSIASNTPSPGEIEPTIEATPEVIRSTPAFHTTRVYNFGGERLYNFWGERLVLSPDNSQIAVITINREIGSDGVHEVKWEEVKLYDYETGQQKYMLQGTTSAAETYIAMAFSPDSQLLAIAGTEQTILVWDVTNGNQVHQFSFWGPVDDLAFSPDGQFLAAVSSSEEPKEQGVGVFDLETETLLAQLEGTAATGVTFFEGDSKVIVGTSYHSEQQTGSSLFFWDFNTNEISKILSQYGGTRAITLSNEREILAAVIDNTLHLIDLQDLTEIEVEKPDVSVRVLSFDNAGNIWALDFDGMLFQWDTHGKLVRQQQFDNATDFGVIPETNHLLISFPKETWEVAFQQ